MSGRNAKFLRKIAATYEDMKAPQRRTGWWKRIWSRLDDRSRGVARANWPRQRAARDSIVVLDLRVHTREEAAEFRAHSYWPVLTMRA